MTTDDGRQWLLGRDRELTLRYLLVAASVLVVGLGLLYWRWNVTPRGLGWSLPGVDPVWLVAAVAVALTAVPGYLDDGLLAAWVLGMAPFVAQALGPAVVPAKAFHEPILVGLATAALLGGVIGTAGFWIGAGVRRVRDVERSTEASSP